MPAEHPRRRTGHRAARYVAADAMDEWAPSSMAGRSHRTRPQRTVNGPDRGGDDRFQPLRGSAQVSPVRQLHLPGPPLFRMPKLKAFFHYRNLDVLAIRRELARRWRPEIMRGMSKQNRIWPWTTSGIHSRVALPRLFFRLGDGWRPLSAKVNKPACSMPIVHSPH